MANRFVKRSLDLVLSAAGLLLLSPLLLSLALLVRFILGSPVLFRQPRPGLRGRIFAIAKFRTMSESPDSGRRRLSDQHRLGSFGKFLRSTSLDELPELWNILRGDMSLVGPRPLLTEYLPLYSSEQARRHEMRPGLTGWAQVNGRNLLSWERRFELDVWYVDHWSIWLDIKIIWMTVVSVLRRDGVSQDGHATMSEFAGSTHVAEQHE